MASILRVNTLTDASSNNSIATSFVAGGSAKCWVTLNGTGTAAILDSLNTSGLTDNGTGDYTVAINNDFSTVNYSLTTGVKGVSGTSNAIAEIDIGTASSASSFKMDTMQAGATQSALDCPLLNCTAHGDLA
jgi:hypothetical protein